MRAGQIIFILSICIASVSAGGSCADQATLNENQLWKILKPSAFELYFSIVLGSISVLGLIFTLCTWRLYRSFSIPTDIIFAICWAELLENSAILASSLYFINHDKVVEAPQGLVSTCTAISVFFSLGNTASLLYNLAFCIVLSISIGKTLRGRLWAQSKYHILILFVIVSITTSLLVSETLGLGVTGICGYRLKNGESIARFVFEIGVVFICLICMKRFHRLVPKNQYFQKVSVFGYYFYYMGLFCLIQILSTTGYMIGNIACRIGADISSDIISYSVTFGSCESILLSLVLIMLRFSHPLVRYKTRRVFQSKFKNQIIDEDSQLEDEVWLGNLLESIKGSQILSFVTAILVSFAEHQHKIQSSSTITKFNFNKNYQMRLNQSVTQQYIMRRVNHRQSLATKQRLFGLRSLHYKITAYSIQVFSQMLAKQRDVNIFQSFDINSNLSLLKRKSYTDGGKSGEFFFGSYDNKFIIKTIKQSQARLYYQKMTHFYQYYQENPKSFIAKIFGLYMFTRTDISQQPIHMILMRNISPHDKSHHERVYDIKGSQFNRSTIDQKKIQNPDKLRNHTLKDEDFKILERRICIAPEYSQSLREQLKKDARFLAKMGVMDYSVLIVKRKGKMRDEDFQYQKGKHNELPSYAKKDEYYDIGIIDYLEPWTLKKKAERAFKTMITNKKVTVTSPQQYCERLSSFLDEII